MLGEDGGQPRWKLGWFEDCPSGLTKASSCQRGQGATKICGERKRSVGYTEESSSAVSYLHTY